MTRRTRDRQAGFTMVELTVALVAGLIVALGIVGLSKEATRTFHEEVRNSAAEATLRTAIDRLRADLQRAGYMSTTNIMRDPRIAKAPNAVNNVAQVAPGMLGIRRLAGIHIFSGAAAANTPLSAKQPIPLSPDAIEIGGNMTCAEQFEIQTITQVGTCQRLTLSANAPALYRINAVGPNAAATELNNVFQPYTGRQYIVRILDDTGRSQYLPTCPGGAPTGVLAGVPFVLVDTNGGPLLSPQLTKGMGGVTSTPGGRAWVNPVQIVRWEITNSALEPAQYANALASQALSPGTQDTNKYDLIRSYVDALGAVVPQTTEVIAEYAVDLEFAFSVESGLNAAAPQVTTYPFDSAANQAWANDVSTTPATQPELIRIVRARVATRTAQPDRTVNIPVPNPGALAFLYRYCVNPAGCGAGALEWARARTITTEVSLPNQAGSFF